MVNAKILKDGDDFAELECVCGEKFYSDPSENCGYVLREIQGIPGKTRVLKRANLVL